jgi:hypothetical protein
LSCYLIVSVAIALSTSYLAVYCLIDLANSVKDEEQKQQHLLFEGHASQSLKETIKKLNSVVFLIQRCPN